jgi:hypothetical protein
MKTIHFKGTDPVKKLKRIGRQVETKKKLEGQDVQIVTKKQAQERWNKVEANFSNK